MENERTFSQRLVAALSEMPALTPDATNPAYRSSYITLGAIIPAVRRVLARHGLAVVQALDGDGHTVSVSTTIIGADGERLELGRAVFAIPERATAQQVGSLITYARRYALATALGIVDGSDDDGNAASNAGDAAQRVRMHRDQHRSEDARRDLARRFLSGIRATQEDLERLRAARIGPDVVLEARDVGCRSVSDILAYAIDGRLPDYPEAEK